MESPFSSSNISPIEGVAPFPRKAIYSSIPDRFVEIANRYPGNISVTDHSQQLSYREHVSQSGKVANVVQQHLGVCSPPQGVALIFDSTVESAIAIMGTLFSGHFFCPIAANDPVERIISYLEDAEIL